MISICSLHIHLLLRPCPSTDQEQCSWSPGHLVTPLTICTPLQEQFLVLSTSPHPPPPPALSIHRPGAVLLVALSPGHTSHHMYPPPGAVPGLVYFSTSTSSSGPVHPQTRSSAPGHLVAWSHLSPYVPPSRRSSWSCLLLHIHLLLRPCPSTDQEQCSCSPGCLVTPLTICTPLQEQFLVLNTSPHPPPPPALSIPRPGAVPALLVAW